MQKQLRWLVFVLLVVAVAAGCVSPGSPKEPFPSLTLTALPGKPESPQKTQTITSTPLPAPSPTPTFTFTPLPTPTPTPSLTPTPTPKPEEAIAALVASLGQKRAVVYHVQVRPSRDIEVTAYFVGYRQGVRLTFEPDVYFGHSLARHAHFLETKDRKGHKLPVAITSFGWVIQRSGNLPFTVDYRIDKEIPLPETGEYFVRITDKGAFFYNQAVFAWPSPAPQEAYVVFDVPTDWVPGTSFTPMGNHLYRVDGPDTLKVNLLSNITRAGLVNGVYHLQCDRVHLTFIDYREGEWDDIFFQAPKAEHADRVREYLGFVCDTIRYYTKAFGQWGGSYFYWASTPAVIGEHTTAYWAYWLQAWGRLRYSDIVHHVLHAYLFGPQMGPSFFLFTGPDAWFAEGLPTYYEAELTTKLTGDNIWWAKSYTNYLSMKRAAQFHELRKRDYIVTYAYAQMQVLALDQEIRRVTGGKKNLDDFLGYLARKYGRRGKGKPFGRREILEALREVTGQDMSSFYYKYLVGYVAPALPPVDEYMASYQEKYIEWIQSYLRRYRYVEGEAGESPSLFFTVLEVGVHRDEGKITHWLFGGAPEEAFNEVCDFFNQHGPFQKKGEFTKALSALTGVDESDFFDFYTVGAYTPSLEEINLWVTACQSPTSAKRGESLISGGTQSGEDALDQKLAIRIDGLPNDWPASLSPIVTDPPEGGEYDLAYVYAFQDQNYLYLRIDPYKPFPSHLSAQFTFEITATGKKTYHFQASIDPEDGKTVHLIPYTAAGQLAFEQQTMYEGASIGQSVEMVIPLRYLGNPTSVEVEVYVIANDASQSYDRCPVFRLP